jgi:hypothetical protein
MRSLKLFPVAAALMTLSGCAGWVVFGHTIEGKQPAQPALTSPASPDPPMLKAVTVTFTPAAQQKIAAEPQFQQASLLTAIETELRAHKLLADHDPHARGTVEISIDDFATRPTSNAAVFGYILGTGTLTGNVEVHATEGKEPKDSRITAESPVAKSVSGGGQANPFGPLYRRFAAATVNSLTGRPAQPVEPHWGQDRPPE